jgi:hypothetical protein
LFGGWVRVDESVWGRGGSFGGWVVENLRDADSHIGSTETREFDTTKEIESGIHARVPRQIPLIRKARPLNSTSRFPYP